MTRPFSLLLFVVLSSQILSAQTEKLVAIRFAYQVYKGQQVNVGLNYAFVLRRKSDAFLAGYHGIFLTPGIRFQNKNIMSNVQTGYEYHIGLFGSKLGTSINTDFSSTSIYILPEAGVSILGLISIMYGYHCTVQTQPGTTIPPHRISLGFSYPLLWIKGNERAQSSALTF